MTPVLLDTNAYLRLAKRIRPVLGVPFGAKQYVLTILPDVEREVRRNPRLKLLFPWFEDIEYASERKTRAIRLSTEEKINIGNTSSVLRNHVTRNAGSFMERGRSPPGETDCWIMAVADERHWIVATDDAGMHRLGEEFGIDVWHCCDALKKMLSAKLIDNAKVREIYEALERNGDLTASWVTFKTTHFAKVFR